MTRRTALFAVLLGAAPSLATGQAAEDPLQTRVELKGVQRISARAGRARTAESGKDTSSHAFGERKNAAGTGPRVGRRVDPGFQVTAPGTPDDTGKPVAAPQVGIAQNITPYQDDLDKARDVAIKNAETLQGASDAARRSDDYNRRLSAITALVTGVIIGLVGAAIARATGQTLQGQLITAIGAFLGALALGLLAGGRVDSRSVDEQLQAATAEQRGRIQANLGDPARTERIRDADWENASQ